MKSSAAATAAAYGFLGGSLTATAVMAFIAWILYVIASWKVFKKFGEPGWKCLIPFYNTYIVFKRTWSAKMFWIFLGIIIVSCILLGLGLGVSGRKIVVINMAFAGIGYIGAIAATILSIVSYHNLSKSFGHGIGYTIGLLFLYFIFSLILGFGSSQYIGPKGEPEYYSRQQ